MNRIQASSFLSVTLVGSSSAGVICLWLLDSSVKSLLILMFGTIVCFFLKRASAATRHWIWATLLIGLIFMPVATVLLPEWRILPSWLSIENQVAEIAATADAPTSFIDSRAFESAIPESTATLVEPAQTAAADLQLNASSLSPTTERVWPLAFRISSKLLLGIWAAGFLLLLAPIALALVRLLRLERNSRTHGDLAPHVLRRVAEIAEALDTKLPRIIVGPIGAMPMVWSLGRGRLLLPKDSDQWQASRLNAVLSHELIHLRRRDPLLFMIGLVACAMHWFNPLAWYAVRRLRIECERACDDHVLRLGVDASEYASHLLDFAVGMRASKGTSSLAFAMATKPTVEQRIVSILDEKLNRRGVTYRRACALLLLMACSVAVLATLRATVANESSEHTDEDKVEIKYPYCVVEVDNLKPRSLSDAITAFNLESQQSPTGVDQRPISEPETLVAIAKALRQTHVAESVKVILREVQKTKSLPAKAYFRRFTRFDDEQQMHGVWWVRLCFEGEFPPLYSVPIRTTHIFTRPYSQLERQQKSERGVTLINRKSSYFEEPPHIKLAEEFPQAAIDKFVGSMKKGLDEKNIDEVKALFDWKGAALSAFAESELQMLIEAKVHSIKVEPLRLEGKLLHWSGFRAYHPNLPVVGYLDIEYSLPEDPPKISKKISLEFGISGDEFRFVNYVAGDPKLPLAAPGFSMRGQTEKLADGIYQLTTLISNPGELLSAHLANEEVWHRDYENKRKPNQRVSNDAPPINKQILVHNHQVERVVELLEKLYETRIDGAQGAAGNFSIIPDVRTNSIFVSAPPADVQWIEAFINFMDQNRANLEDGATNATGAISKEIALGNIDVIDIVRTLKLFFGKKVEVFGDLNAQPTPQHFVDALKAAGQSTEFGTKVVLVTDKRAKVLWIFALPQDIAKCEELVNAIDTTETRRDFAADELIAVVETEKIFAGDLIPFIEPILEKNRGNIPPAQENLVKNRLIRDVLVQYVEIKALYLEFLRDMAGTKSPKGVEEMRAKVLMKAAQIFHDKQMPVMLKRYNVNNLADLERKLLERLMSISTLKAQFTERVLASELERKYVPQEFEFSAAELLDYYQTHNTEWNVSSRAKWREICVLFSKHTRKEADVLIKDFGNQVYLGSKPFEAVAKQHSEGTTAADGGIFDWTSQGSLKSAAVDNAIFSQPLGRLGQVIESEVGFHIIEVLEREPAYKKSFEAAQVEIRQKLSKERREKLLAAFDAKIVAQTKIWTLWPQDIPNSKPLAEHANALKPEKARDQIPSPNEAVQGPAQIPPTTLPNPLFNAEPLDQDEIKWLAYTEATYTERLENALGTKSFLLRPVKPLLENPSAHIQQIRLIDRSTGNPVPGVKLRIQSVTADQADEQPIQATSDSQGLVSVVVSEGATVSIEVISNEWWQVAKILLVNPVSPNVADKDDATDKAEGSNRPIEIKLNRGQPVDIIDISATTTLR